VLFTFTTQLGVKPAKVLLSQILLFAYRKKWQQLEQQQLNDAIAKECALCRCMSGH
jgi:hypothetical protein